MIVRKKSGSRGLAEGAFAPPGPGEAVSAASSGAARSPSSIDIEARELLADAGNRKPSSTSTMHVSRLAWSAVEEAAVGDLVRPSGATPH
jgi:hypothetical protein